MWDTPCSGESLLWQEKGGVRKAAFFAAAILFCAIISCIAFWVILTAWGFVFAPWVKMQSASFVIIISFFGSATITVAVWQALWKKRIHRYWECLKRRQ